MRYQYQVVHPTRFHEVGWIVLNDEAIVLPLVNVPGTGAVVLFAPDKGVVVKGEKGTFSEVADGLEALLEQRNTLSRLGLSLDPQWIAQVKAERAAYFAAKKRRHDEKAGV
ncbi:MAG TPA: hypothetical protein G4O04_03765 [Anaerolineae bacterium]|nr:hypothetical protein [Anaerolineae bacterium]HID84109.1 hypothetical protein [Anaerolineales bacterium]HIQ08633.1 hypothetical protein [Anaerolineaceae bacterium]